MIASFLISSHLFFYLFKIRREKQNYLISIGICLFLSLSRNESHRSTPRKSSRALLCDVLGQCRTSSQMASSKWPRSSPWIIMMMRHCSHQAYWYRSSRKQWFHIISRLSYLPDLKTETFSLFFFSRSHTDERRNSIAGPRITFSCALVIFIFRIWFVIPDISIPHSI
jgi:hypothetical protein